MTIDNLDGLGAVDYSAAVCADGPLKIERVLNAPSRCSGMLDVSDAAVGGAGARGGGVVGSDLGSGRGFFPGVVGSGRRVWVAERGKEGGVGGGRLEGAGGRVGWVKEVANDVTVSGEIEPTAYIAETFAGDGTTAVFQLAETPFRAKATASRVLTDSFDRGAFDHRIWKVNDSGAHLGFSAGGLTMTGGNGFDGHATPTAVDAVEVGGA